MDALFDRLSDALDAGQQVSFRGVPVSLVQQTPKSLIIHLAFAVVILAEPLARDFSVDAEATLAQPEPA